MAHLLLWYSCMVAVQHIGIWPNAVQCINWEVVFKNFKTHEEDAHTFYKCNKAFTKSTNLEKLKRLRIKLYNI